MGESAFASVESWKISPMGAILGVKTNKNAVMAYDLLNLTEIANFQSDQPIKLIAVSDRGSLVLLLSSPPGEDRLGIYTQRRGLAILSRTCTIDSSLVQWATTNDSGELILLLQEGSRLNLMGVNLTTSMSWKSDLGHYGFESAAFEGSSKRLVIGCSKDKIILVDYKTRRIFKRFRIDEEREVRRIASVDFGMSGRLVVCSLDNGDVHLLDISETAMRSSLHGLKPVSDEVSISCDGSYLVATNHSENLIQLFGLIPMKAMKWSENGYRKMLSIDFIKGESRMVAGCADGSLLILNEDSGGVILDRSVSLRSITCVAVSGNGKRIASVDEDGIIKIWDHELSLSLVINEFIGKRITDLVFLGDGRSIAVCYKKVCIVNIDNSAIRELDLPRYDEFYCCSDDDGNLLVVAGSVAFASLYFPPADVMFLQRDQFDILWRERLSILSLYIGRPYVLSKNRVCVHRFVFDAKSGNALGSLIDATPWDYGRLFGAFTSNGKLGILYGEGSLIAYIIDIDGERRLECMLDAHSIEKVVLGPDGRTLIVRNEEGHVRCWDLAKIVR